MISLHYTSHTKAYNTIYAACNIVEAIYSFTVAGFGIDSMHRCSQRESAGGLSPPPCGHLTCCFSAVAELLVFTSRDNESVKTEIMQ